jgi:hypothetical protein
MHMFAKTPWLCLLFALLCGSTNVFAQTTVQPWPDAPIALRGANPSAEAVFSFPSATQRTGAVQLQIALAVSERLDPNRTILSVEVDDQPFRSVQLANLARDATGVVHLDAALDEVSAGFHRVRVDGTLVVRDDLCGDYRSRWLRILAPSKLTSGPAPISEAVGISSWRAASGGVHITTTGASSSDLWLAHIEADHMLREWALKPDSHSHRTLNLVANTEGIVLPDVVGARLDIVGDAMTIHARDAESLHRAVVAVMHNPAQTLCEGATCDLSLSAMRDSTENSGTTTSTPTTVWSLSNNRSPTGWLARGPGEHTLHFDWIRPFNWHTLAWPEVTLMVRAGSLGQVDSRRSYVEVRFAGHPLSSWSMDDVTQSGGRLVTRIPSSLWNERVWSFDVWVTLVDKGEVRCRVESEQAWVSVEGESRLDVPRDEMRGPGVATVSAVPGLVALEIPDELGAETASSAAVALWPLRARRMGVAWHLATRGQPRISINKQSRFRRVDIEGVLRVVDSDRDGEVPVLNASNTVTVECLNVPCDHVGLWVPSVAAMITAPSWIDLHARAAVGVGERWSQVNGSDGVRRTIVPRVSPGAAVARAVSREEQKLRRTDITLLAFAAVILVVGAFWIARSQHQRKSLMHHEHV